MSDLETFRKSKDAFMRSKSSPLAPAERKRFAGLRYFPESEAYRVTAALEPYEDRPRVELTTSLGDTQPYLRWGVARFQLGGEACALTLFAPTSFAPTSFAPTGAAAPERFFIPFKDATSGTETYAAGRYLKAERREDGRVLLDFNYAYNPLCAYSERYRCPLPPAENALPVPVRAGERAYEAAGKG